MLRLRPFRCTDAEKIVSWFNDSLSFYKWSAGRFGEFPLSGERLIEYYAEEEKNGTAMPFTAYDEQGAAGHLIIRFLDEELKDARLGFITVDSARRGQNLGGEMLKLAIAYCRDFLRAERVSLGVFLNNPAAIRCYEKAGFTAIEGSECEVEMAGESWGLIEMEIRL